MFPKEVNKILFKKDFSGLEGCDQKVGINFDLQVQWLVPWSESVKWMLVAAEGRKSSSGLPFINPKERSIKEIEQNTVDTFLSRLLGFGSYNFRSAGRSAEAHLANGSGGRRRWTRYASFDRLFADSLDSWLSRLVILPRSLTPVESDLGRADSGGLF